MSISEEQKKLWEQISLKRQELNQAYGQDEKTTEKVMSLSQELDRLLIAYDKLMKQNDEAENET